MVSPELLVSRRDFQALQSLVCTEIRARPCPVTTDESRAVGQHLGTMENHELSGVLRTRGDFNSIPHIATISKTPFPGRSSGRSPQGPASPGQSRIWRRLGTSSQSLSGYSCGPAGEKVSEGGLPITEGPVAGPGPLPPYAVGSTCRSGGTSIPLCTCLGWVAKRTPSPRGTHLPLGPA